MSSTNELLKNNELFSSLDDEQIKKIERIGRILTFNAGETIFEEESLENELYIILNGQVEIFSHIDSIEMSKTVSKSQTIISLWPGQSFGEIALVDNGPRIVSARSAMDGTTLFSISRRELLLLCNSYPEFGYCVMFNLATNLANKFRRADIRLRQSLLYGEND